MAALSAIIGIISSLVLLFGQLGRIDLFQYNFALIDIVLVVLAIVNTVVFLKHRPKQFKINPYLLIFLFLALVSYLINLPLHPLSLKPFFYFLRLTSLIFLLAFPTVISLQPYISIALITNILFGFLQYFIWPSFIAFGALNWDPHNNRLISTYFDPTFTGLIYLFFLIYLYFSKFPFRRFLLVITYIAMALTYSRSTLLAFGIAFTYISLKLKRKNLLIFTLIILGLTVILLPRVPGESTNLERTSSIRAKIVNYQAAAKLFIRHPVLGVGYNNIPYFRTDVLSESHAIGGFDGSLMTLLVATGIIGFIPLIFGLFKLFTSADILRRSLLLSLFIHSFFANSLLYPFVILVLIFLPYPNRYK